MSASGILALTQSPMLFKGKAGSATKRSHHFIGEIMLRLILLVCMFIILQPLFSFVCNISARNFKICHFSSEKAK